uniref:Translational regulator CsrA n=1 Tax=uncultured bacterium A1Q1_fos_291 TaxID=1256570 RepID=L7VYA8_9BACT|nr:carbon storage regulator [uncultured bacterium A1Q1_fos_291]
MLVLSRKRNESVIINDNIVVTVIDVRGDKVRIGIEAPRDVSVHRQEVLEAILSEKLKFPDKASEESSGSVAI